MTVGGQVLDGADCSGPMLGTPCILVDGEKPDGAAAAPPPASASAPLDPLELPAGDGTLLLPDDTVAHLPDGSRLGRLICGEYVTADLSPWQLVHGPGAGAAQDTGGPRVRPAALLPVHRLVLAATHGYVSPDAATPRLPCEVVMHICGNKRCVNPRHLWWGRQVDNAQQGNLAAQANAFVVSTTNGEHPTLTPALPPRFGCEDALEPNVVHEWRPFSGTTFRSGVPCAGLR